ncbi:ATP-binding protein [Nonomuraea sp. NPDC050328]|uniref:ATP-binding protein n=1 Tax=Nonomuraea sp. NPDC050328 TaxID=3364361 RepID=UPI0037A2574C
MIRSRDDVWTAIEDSSAIGAARRRATALAEAAGFDEHDSGRVALAVTEAASNLIKHAVEGGMLIRVHPESVEAVEVIALDRGPGIQDLNRALRDGYSTAGTLGVGLGGIARMASAHEVHSMPGRGTVLAMCFTKADVPPPPLRVSGLTRPIGEEVVSGDAFACADSPELAVIMMCDGLGHGEPAANASRQAVRAFVDGDPFGSSPAETLRRVHRALAGTRGGAVAVARLDRVAGTVRYAGLGNISGWVVRSDGRQGMISVPGIAGHHSRTLREYDYAVSPQSLVVLHSDGLSERWDLSGMRGVTARAPAVVAATLLREAGTRRDDACVAVLRAASPVAAA